MEVSLNEIKEYGYSDYEYKRITGKLKGINLNQVFNANRLMESRATIRDLTYFLFYRKESLKIEEFIDYMISLNPTHKKASYYAHHAKRALTLGTHASAAPVYAATVYHQAATKNQEIKKLGLIKLKELLTA